MSIHASIAESMSPALESVFGYENPARRVLSKFGTDAHVWIPGIGYFNGLQASNFIDSAGTQAGLVDNPVGLVRNALNLNPNELISNGTFTDSTAGWTGVAPFGGTAVLSVVNGQLELANSTTQPARAVQGITTIIGRQYSVSLIAKISTAQSASIRITNDSQGATPEIAAASTSNLSDTVLTTTFTATATTTYVALICAYVSGPAPVAYFDNISVREVTGAITATQGTTANKPILRRGAVNIRPYSDAILVSNSYSVVNATLATATAATPTGSPTASLLTLNVGANTGNSADGFNFGAGTTLTNSTQYTQSLFVKPAGRTILRLRSNVSGAVFDFTLIGNGTAPTPSGDLQAASIVPFANGWYRVSWVFTSTTTVPGNRFDYWAIKTDVADGINGVYVAGAQLELGSTTSEYIPTTTAAASSSSGNYYWQFDGSNDSLALSSVPFQMADDHAVIAGARQSAGGSNKFLFSPAGQPATTRTIASIYADTNGNWAVLWRDDAGTIGTAFASAGALPLGSIGVISGIKSGNNKKIRINGAQSGSTNTTAMGATTVSVGYIGADQNSAQGFLGSIFPVIAIKGTVSDADLLILERWVGQMSGVSI